MPKTIVFDKNGESILISATQEECIRLVHFAFHGPHPEMSIEEMEEVLAQDKHLSFSNPA